MPVSFKEAAPSAAPRLIMYGLHASQAVTALGGATTANTAGGGVHVTLLEANVPNHHSVSQ